jgi:hypothetical protein
VLMTGTVSCQRHFAQNPELQVHPAASLVMTGSAEVHMPDVSHREAFESLYCDFEPRRAAI